MATETQLIAWAIANADQLQLKVEHSTWIKEFFPDLTDTVVHIAHDRHQFVGWGWAQNEQTAICKALAEALERIILHQKKFETSNGIAAHLDLERAVRAAEAELIERDLFLCHFYSKKHFVPFKKNELLGPIQKFAHWLKEKQVRIKFYQLSENGVVCAIDCREAGFGYSFGAAIKENLTGSVLAATVEAGRKVHRVLSGVDQIESISLNDFYKLRRPLFLDHGKLAFDLNYAEQISFLFEQNANSQNSKIQEVSISPLKLEGETFKNCPLVFAKATSEFAQKLFTGAPNPDLINFKRLSAFSGNEVTWGDVCHLPHPFD